MSDYKKSSYPKPKLGPMVPKNGESITIAFSTRAGLNLWLGRPTEHDRKAILGMPGFAARLRMISDHVKNDDPYADHILYQIDKRTDEVKAELDVEMRQITEFINAQIPEEMQLPDIGSNRPAVVTVQFGSPLAFKVAFQIITVDQIVRKILMANHVSLLDKDARFLITTTLLGTIRSIINIAFRFQPTGVSRDDIAANNPKAIEARARMGELPEEFLSGVLRSPLAPALPLSRINAINKMMSDKNDEDQSKGNTAEKTTTKKNEIEEESVVTSSEEEAVEGTEKELDGDAVEQEKEEVAQG